MRTEGLVAASRDPRVRERGNSRICFRKKLAQARVTVSERSARLASISRMAFVLDDRDVRDVREPRRTAC